jgi:hypothetical protein
MPDKLKTFIQDSIPYIGKSASDVASGAQIADWLTIRRFCASIGDMNPLYKDLASSASSVYHTLIAPPTFIAAIRTATSGAAYDQKDYQLAKVQTKSLMEWVDVIRLGDRLKSDLIVTDVRTGISSNEKPSAEIESLATYSNSYGGQIGTAIGISNFMPITPGSDLVTDRDTYRYSDQEILDIEKAIESESPPRGKLLLYWNDVTVGDSLPKYVKGPLNLQDMMAWVVAEQKTISLGAPVFFDLAATPGRIRTNPTTNWPFWDSDQEYEDILSVRNMGFVTPVSRGLHRACTAGQVITDWMGDDGFLRNMDVSLPNHFLYGDTMWLSGKVTDKYKETLGGQPYHAVRVNVVGVNQLDQTILDCSSLIYLPNPGSPVFLPIPHNKSS